MTRGSESSRRAAATRPDARCASDVRSPCESLSRRWMRDSSADIFMSAGTDGVSATCMRSKVNRVLHHGDRDMPRRPGMLDQRQPDLAALHEAAVPAQAIEGLGGQITLLQQGQSQIFGERGIGCGRHQGFGGCRGRAREESVDEPRLDRRVTWVELFVPGLRNRFLSPFQGSLGFRIFTQGLRPGLHSFRRFAARLGRILTPRVTDKITRAISPRSGVPAPARPGPAQSRSD